MQMVFLLLPIFALAQLSEYTIKAVFLERFTRFIEWPVEIGMSDTSEPFVLGVIGENPFGSIIDEIYVKQKIKGKNVEVRYFSKLDEIDECHLLFISNSNKNGLHKILSHTRKRPALTVSDTKGFGKKGVLINFYLDEGKLRFEINESAVRESGLSMSCLLLRHAKIVNPIKE